MTSHFPVLLVEANFLLGTINQKHFPNLCSDTSFTYLFILFLFFLIICTEASNVA